MNDGEYRDFIPEEQFEQFIRSFENQTIRNADDKEIKLTVRERPPDEITGNKPSGFQPWLIEFQGYPGEMPVRAGIKKDGEENFIKFTFNPKSTTVTNQYSKLSHPELRGKGVYPSLRLMIGKNFPEKLKLSAEIDNARNRQDLLNMHELYTIKQIDGKTLKNQLLEIYLIKQWRDAGFNSFLIDFGNESSVTLTMEKIQGPTEIHVTEQGIKYIN